MSWTQIIMSAVFGIIIAAVVGFTGSTHIAAAPAAYPSSPAAAVATTTMATSTQPVILKKVAAATSSPSAVSKKPAEQKPAEPAKPTAPAPTVPASQEVAAEPQDPDAVTKTVRGAVVNIICTTGGSGSFGSISGSGVFIDSRGVILTNSHIAQYFLLKDYPTAGSEECVIRSGSPAVSRYTADLLFMPPSWVAQNAYKIKQKDPTGDGEHDYALLRVTGMVNPSAQMPAAFPALALSTAPPAGGQSVLLAAYPAQFLGGITVANSLYETSAIATVGDLYTFVSDTLDLFSIGGSVVAQKGSSGGAVADGDGTLLGLIVTASEGANTSSSDLRAISMPYIIRDFQKESGVSLAAFLGGDIVQEEQQFSVGVEPTLRADLANALGSN